MSVLVVALRVVASGRLRAAEDAPLGACAADVRPVEALDLVLSADAVVAGPDGGVASGLAAEAGLARAGVAYAGPRVEAPAGGKASAARAVADPGLGLDWVWGGSGSSCGLPAVGPRPVVGGPLGAAAAGRATLGPTAALGEVAGAARAAPPAPTLLGPGVRVGVADRDVVSASLVAGPVRRAGQANRDAAEAVAGPPAVEGAVDDDWGAWQGWEVA